MGLLDFSLDDLFRNSALGQQFPGMLQQDQANYGPQLMGQPPINSMASLSQPTPAPMQPVPANTPPMRPAAAPPAPPALAATANPGMASFTGTPELIPAIFNGLAGAVTGQPFGPASDRINQQRALISGLREKGVSNADITAALYNPEYMKKVLDNSVKEQDDFRPATKEERISAGMTGDNNTPLFINKRTNEPKFGPPQTNVNVNTEKTGQAELATENVKAYTGAQTAGRESQKRVAMYDAFEKAAQGFTPGATAEMRLTAKRYLKDAGLIRGEDVPDGEVMQMISRQLGIHAQPKGQGAVSNYERELFAKSLPNMTQSPEGLKLAIGISRSLEQYDQKVAQIYRESARANKGLPNYLDVQDKIAGLGSPLSDSQMGALGGQGNATSAAPKAAAPQPGFTKDGFRFKGGNPADQANWEPFT